MFGQIHHDQPSKNSATWVSEVNEKKRCLAYTDPRRVEGGCLTKERNTQPASTGPRMENEETEGQSADLEERQGRL